MVSNFVIALIVGAGLGFFSYNKLARNSGGNTKNAAVGSAVIALFVTIVGTILLDSFVKK